MPRRSNLFQDVVGIIHRHMAGDAVIEVSAMLLHKVTGEQREVDVVIRSEVARHEVVVALEATSAARPSRCRMGREMLGKHRDLPTDKLVLVSEAGVTRQAREIAEDAGQWHSRPSTSQRMIPYEDRQQTEVELAQDGSPNAAAGAGLGSSPRQRCLVQGTGRPRHPSGGRQECRNSGRVRGRQHECPFRQDH